MDARDVGVSDGEHEGGGAVEVQGAGAAREVQDQEGVMRAARLWRKDQAEEIRLNEEQMRRLDAGIVKTFVGAASTGAVVSVGEFLLGRGGPILVGAGIPLPPFVELPLPWWCRPEVIE